MPDEPRVDRTITLHFQGDWGGANLHRVAGWIGMQVNARCGPGSRFAIWNGRGFADNVRAVGRGEVDMALATPSTFVTAALDGRGVYEGEAYPNLRAIGQVPQNDRMLLAVHPDAGVRSFAELRQRRVPLRIATGLDDGVNHVGVAARHILELEGVPRADIESWGGELLESEQPAQCHAFVRQGRASAILNEAIMTPPWHELAEQGWAFFQTDRSVTDELERRYGWRGADLPAGYYAGQTEPIHALDFSDFLLVVRDDMPDDVAYLMAWALTETREQLERGYRHLKPERSPVTWPLDPSQMGRAPIPLHPAAERHYRERGYL
jgi:TRAP transporter TAXI family solute receptor